MTLYVDTSALIKRYVDEPGSERATQLLAGDRQLTTARHTIVEMRRNIPRLLPTHEAAAVGRAFARDLAEFTLVELDPVTCDLAAEIAEQTGLRTLDALHLGAAKRLGAAISFLTFDVRQAEAARSLGFRVLGA